MKVFFGPPFFKKIFIEFVTRLLLFYVCLLLLVFFFFWPRGIWDLSSPNKDQTHNPCIGRRGLNHWAAREVPDPQFFVLGIYPEVELLSHMMILFLILKESSYSFPQWLYHFIFPPRMQKRSGFSTSYQHLFVCFFWLCHMACLMLVPQPGWNLGHLAAWNPNHGIPNTCFCLSVFR